MEIYLMEISERWESDLHGLSYSFVLNHKVLIRAEFIVVRRSEHWAIIFNFQDELKVCEWRNRWKIILIEIGIIANLFFLSTAFYIKGIKKVKWMIWSGERKSGFLKWGRWVQIILVNQFVSNSHLRRAYNRTFAKLFQVAKYVWYNDWCTVHGPQQSLR